MKTEFDPIRAVTAADPTRQYTAVAAERSLLWHRGRGMWIAAHPDIVREVLESPACRVRPGGEPVPSHLVGTPAGVAFGRFARMRDGDEHMRSRWIVEHALDAIELDAVRSVTMAQAADMPASDLDRYVFELPVRVVGSVLGVPHGELGVVSQWTRALVGCVHASANQPDVDAGVEAAVRLDQVFHRLIRSPEPPVVIATMKKAIRSEGPTTDEVVANMIGLLFQTHDATAGLIGNAIVQLSRHPAAMDEATDAVIARTARQDPSVHNTRRFVVRDTVIAGQRVAAGDTILVVLAAAGAAEPDPLWTFGAGPHGCPGKSVALTIASAAIASLVGRGVLPAELPHPVAYYPLANVRVPALSPARLEAHS